MPRLDMAINEPLEGQEGRDWLAAAKQSLLVNLQE